LGNSIDYDGVQIIGRPFKSKINEINGIKMNELFVSTNKNLLQIFEIVEE